MSTTKSVRQQILDLAAHHGVGTEMTDLDHKANAISYLSDNDLDDSNDPAFQALVNLRRAGVLNAEEGHRLLFALTDEEDRDNDV